MSAVPKTGAVAIIPVRVDSQRLPGKALLAESGRALFLHTCERARRAECFDQVLVATDSAEVAEAAQRGGFTPVMTSSKPRTGSERCAEAAADLDTGIVVDIQGDWPEVDPEDLRELVASLAGNSTDRACATLCARLEDAETAADPNVVKVVRGHDGAALYFSRSPIPFRRKPDSHTILRHIGVYGFSRATLLRLPDLPSSGLDEIEGLEQLRFLENGIRIQVLDARGDAWGIECRSDYDAFLRRHSTMPPELNNS